MARKKSKYPTELELEILKVLWEASPQVVREVREENRNHAIKVGGLRFRLSKLEENGEGFLQAGLGVAEGFEVEEFRLFDHKTRELLHHSDWQRPRQRHQKFFVERVGATEHIRLKEAGGEFPDKIDVWMRVTENDRGPVIWIPGVAGGTGQAGKSRIVLKRLLAGTMNGRGETHLPGRVMLWDLSTVYNEDSSLTLNIENQGDVLRGRYYLVAVKKDGSRHPSGRLQFTAERQFNYANFNVAVADLDHFELTPYKAKHKFFFNGVKVPGTTLPELSDGPKGTIGTIYLDGTKLTVKDGGKKQTVDLADHLDIDKDTDWEKLDKVGLGGATLVIDRKPNGLDLTLREGKKDGGRGERIKVSWKEQGNRHKSGGSGSAHSE